MKNRPSGKAERVAIILPNKLGDAILSLPLILCLRGLTAAFGSPGSVIEVVTYSPVVEVFAAVGVPNVTEMNLAAKLRSWLIPPDRAFFLVATSKNFGFHARCTYGRHQRNKMFVRYDHDLACLGEDSLPPELDEYLTADCRLSRYAVRQFGVVLELGYSPEQILSTFTFSRQILPVDRPRWASTQNIEAPYLICCMEAAGGKGRRNERRRWSADHYLTLARRIREEYGYRIAFIGIAADPPVPVQDGFTDLRGRLNLWQLFQLMAGAAGYFGNDTGPMHMANLVGIPSVGVYPAGENDHAPLFGELNSAVMRPANADDVYPAVQRMILADRTA
jgi:ADP-heptose:LPS heptosyltransferase